MQQTKYAPKLTPYPNKIENIQTSKETRADAKKKASFAKLPPSIFRSPIENK